MNKLDPKVTNVLMNLFDALAPGTTITLNVPPSKIIIPGRKNITSGGQLIVTRPAVPITVNVTMSGPQGPTIANEPKKTIEPENKGDNEK